VRRAHPRLRDRLPQICLERLALRALGALRLLARCDQLVAERSQRVLQLSHL
jgi:hypothetical protein